MALKPCWEPSSTSGEKTDTVGQKARASLGKGSVKGLEEEEENLQGVLNEGDLGYAGHGTED